MIRRTSEECVIKESDKEKVDSGAKKARKISLDEEKIPIPPVRTGPKKATRFKYPFDKLEVGGSFFVEGIQARAIAGSIANASKVLGFKYVSRSMDGGARVWRVK